MVFYNNFIESENIKILKTREAFEKELAFLPCIYDYFLALPFFVGNLCDDNDENMVKIQDSFLFFIYDVPFKLRSIYTLLEIGNYADSASLLRTFVESTLIYKYYIMKNDGAGLSQYILSPDSIKPKLEGVLPGYYKSIYAALCGFSHGNPLAQAVFRGNVSREEPTKTNLKNINTKWFNYVSNQAVSVLPCIIKMYKTVYPNNIVSQNPDMVQKEDEIITTISNFVEWQVKNDTEKKTFYHYYKKLIEL